MKTQRVSILIRPASLEKLDAIRDDKRLAGRGGAVEWLIRHYLGEDSYDELAVEGEDA